MRLRVGSFECYRSNLPVRYPPCSSQRVVRYPRISLTRGSAAQSCALFHTFVCGVRHQCGERRPVSQRKGFAIKLLEQKKERNGGQN
jgi:hypothetical protein